MQDYIIWIIAALSILLVLVRPWHWPEAIWSVAGACLLVLLGLLPASAALNAVGKARMSICSSRE